MLRLYVAEPNPPAGFRSSAARKNSNRSKRRNKKAMKRMRDRRGRFLTKGRRKAKGRSRSHGRRSGGKRRRSSARRRRTSNPPRKTRSTSSRRRSSSRRPVARGKIRYRTRTVVKRARRRNPPYTLKNIAIGLVLVAGGYAGVKWLPGLIVKIAKKPEWALGWKPVALSAAATLLIAGLGYGIARLITNKRTAAMVGGELLIGGAIATGVSAYQTWKAMPAAPVAPNPQLSAGAPKGFSPQQFADAQSAARLLGLGGFSPSQFAAAGATSRDFGRESF